MYRASELLTSYQDILSILPQEKVMEKYLGTSKGSICSPFRVDNKPGCTFYYGNDSVLYLRDWAVNKKYNCIQVVMHMEGLSFEEALSHIRTKFGVQKPTAGLNKRAAPLLQAVTQKWNDPARNYWKQYGIDHKILRKYGVRNAAYVYRNKSLIARATPQNPIFVYTFKGTDKIKIYRPLATAKQYKWLGNVTRDIWNGYTQLPKRGKLLIITSSLKDVMALHVLGFSAIAPQSENALINEEFRSGLENRFDRIVILFDNDDPGIRAAMELSEVTSYPWITLPDNIHSKDISDGVSKVGQHRCMKILKKKLSRLYRQDDLPF